MPNDQALFSTFSSMTTLKKVKLYHWQILVDGTVVADIMKGSARKSPWHVLDMDRKLVATGYKNKEAAAEAFWESIPVKLPKWS